MQNNLFINFIVCTFEVSEAIRHRFKQLSNMYISKLALPIDCVLWQNKTWSIELLSERNELAVTNGWNIYYAYYDRVNNLLRWDNPYPVPLYVQKQALIQADKSNMLSIYN